MDVVFYPTVYANSMAQAFNRWNAGFATIQELDADSNATPILRKTGAQLPGRHW